MLVTEDAMDESAGALAAAISETTCFLFHFKDLEDPRQQHNVTYPLAEVLLLCLLAVLGGSNGAVDIARFGKGKIEDLPRFLPFCDGTPSHDQIGDILAVLDPAKFQQCFVAWVMALTGAP